LPEPLAVGIDVGGTKIAVGAVRGDGTLHRLERLPTAATTLSGLAAAAARVGEGLDAEAVGVGICEVLDEHGVVRSHVTIDWTAAELEDALGPIVLDADVRAAALAEARFGAGGGFSSFVYLTVGTGISHTLVVDGEPYRGAHGCAQLVGSAVLEFACPHCGRRSRLSAEEVASGAALARGAAVADAAATLGSFVALLVNVLDPEAVVVGGGLGTAGGAYWDALVAGVREHIWAEHVRGLPVLPAGLGADSGVIGAGLQALGARRAQEVT
jgi:glucokinase